MNLLIITQKADRDDPILGFFHRWIVEFSRHFDAVTVICLEEGKHDLPANVKVFSLGKEKGASKAASMLRFFQLITAERSRYDAVFVHMNPIYIVLAAPLWKLWGKKIFLWYTHRAVDLKLRIAAACADRIFTASERSFNLPSPKVIVTGHGIDASAFSSVARTKAFGAEPLKIVSVGRITPIKDPITLIKAASLLKKRLTKKIKVTFVGGPVTEADKAYAEKVRAQVASSGLNEEVAFIGDISPVQMPNVYKDVDFAVNLTPTGGIDKVVLEAMAAGIPVFTSNEAFRPYFNEYADRLIFTHADPADLANKIEAVMKNGSSASIGAYLQGVVKEKADIAALIGKISDEIRS